MKRSESVALYKALNGLGELKGVNFSYAVVRNINRLKPEMEALDKVLEGTKEYNEYLTKKQELLEEHSEKDEKGNAIKNELAPNVFKYKLSDEAAFAVLLDELNEKYKEALDARVKQEEEYKELLDSEISIDLFKVKLEHIPEEITTQQMFGISAIIEDKE